MGLTNEKNNDTIPVLVGIPICGNDYYIRMLRLQIIVACLKIYINQSTSRLVKPYKLVLALFQSYHQLRGKMQQLYCVRGKKAITQYSDSFTIYKLDIMIGATSPFAEADLDMTCNVILLVTCFKAGYYLYLL
ncbi:hypothetical protein RF11_14936 [Thelohanellus kitauei]|uniref:Uncharacterized protein n=1 Tax=Thelohanellus kitauei TaxID=669202 RepID=A0A0C2J364_THEKT|nr:hypothetical protein RF11_14936 [Thelohanellus kitauei]